MKFETILKLVKNESFDDNKVVLISELVPNLTVLPTWHEVDNLLSSMTFDDGKQSALNIISPKMIVLPTWHEVQNIMSTMTHDDGKEYVMNIILPKFSGKDLKENRLNAEVIARLEKCFTFDDGKISMIRQFVDCKLQMSITTVEEFKLILNQLTYDSSKDSVVEILRPFIGRLYDEYINEQNNAKEVETAKFLLIKDEQKSLHKDYIQFGKHLLWFVPHGDSISITTSILNADEKQMLMLTLSDGSILHIKQTGDTSLSCCSSQGVVKVCGLEISGTGVCGVSSITVGGKTDITLPLHNGVLHISI